MADQVLKYNKTKRGLENSAAIIAVCFFTVELFIGIYFIICYGLYKATGGLLLFYLLLCIFICVVSIFGIMDSVKLMPQPKPNINMEYERIFLLVLSFCSGNFITMGLMIAVRCMDDYISVK